MSYGLRYSSQPGFVFGAWVAFSVGLLEGKGLFFVNSVDSCYRLKLFLEQFSIRSAVLNAELPLNSRLHILQEYNRGIFDYLIATDASLDAGKKKKPKAPMKQKVVEEDDEDDKEDESEGEDGEGSEDDDDDEEPEEMEAAAEASIKKKGAAAAQAADEDDEGGEWYMDNVWVRSYGKQLRG